MANIFNPQEILKIAINVEANGEKLYAALEAKASGEKVKTVWKHLKEEEVEHRKTFQEMLDNAGEYIVYESYEGEIDAYLKAIASEYIITQDLAQQKSAESFANDLDAVNFGIQIEKDSILTYSAFKKYIRDSKKAVLDKVIGQERHHLSNLVLLKASLKKEG